MNTETLGERGDRALRAVLADQRPAGAAPAELRDRVLRIPAESRPGGRLEPFRAPASAAGRLAVLAAAAVLTIAVVATLASRPMVPGPGTSPPPGGTAQAFDPSIEGMGIATAVVDTLSLVPWIVGVLGGVVLGGLAIRSERRGRIGVLGLAIVVMAGALWLSSVRGFEMGYGWGPSSGLDVRADAPPGSNGPDVLYVTAEPGGHFVVTLVVRNPGPLPIRVGGLVEDLAEGVLAPRWTALWLYTDAAGGIPGREAASPFSPVEVAPDGYVVLYAVGQASRCAFGPSFALADLENVGLVSRDNPRLAYSVLGLSAASEIELPFVIAEPYQPNCPG